MQVVVDRPISVTENLAGTQLLCDDSEKTRPPCVKPLRLGGTLKGGVRTIPADPGRTKEVELDPDETRTLVRQILGSPHEEFLHVAPLEIADFDDAILLETDED